MPASSIALPEIYRKVQRQKWRHFAIWLVIFLAIDGGIFALGRQSLTTAWYGPQEFSAPLLEKLRSISSADQLDRNDFLFSPQATEYVLSPVMTQHVWSVTDENGKENYEYQYGILSMKDSATGAVTAFSMRIDESIADTFDWSKPFTASVTAFPIEEEKKFASLSADEVFGDLEWENEAALEEAETQFTAGTIRKGIILRINSTANRENLLIALWALGIEGAILLLLLARALRWQWKSLDQHLTKYLSTSDIHRLQTESHSVRSALRSSRFREGISLTDSFLIADHNLFVVPLDRIDAATKTSRMVTVAKSQAGLLGGGIVALIRKFNMLSAELSLRYRTLAGKRKLKNIQTMETADFDSLLMTLQLMISKRGLTGNSSATSPIVS